MTRLASLALVATLISAIASTCAQANGKLKVTATFSILADITQHIGGDRVDIKTLVAPAQDVHVYQPSPSDAAALANSQVLITNGLGFEGWMDRLLAASDFKGISIVASNGVPTLGAALDGSASHPDPHAWQDVSNVLIYVSSIKNGLCQADAQGCESYTRNADAYSAELRALDNEIKSKFAAIPAASRKVITSHDAFGYFGRAYGVTFLAPLGLSTEQEASAATLARLITQVKTQKITAIFVESSANTKLIEQIARETGTTPGPRLYSDTLSDPAATYIGMMRYNANALAAAMAKN